MKSPESLLLPRSSFTTRKRAVGLRTKCHGAGVLESGATEEPGFQRVAKTPGHKILRATKASSTYKSRSTAVGASIDGTRTPVTSISMMPPNAFGLVEIKLIQNMAAACLMGTIHKSKNRSSPTFGPKVPLYLSGQRSKAKKLGHGGLDKGDRNGK
jgi:hypothetical protein